MRRLRSFPALALAFVATLAFAVAPASAQSRLRDAETEALLEDMINPLVEASELEPGNVEVVLINDNSINAFVAGGQVIYVHTGLINAAETANEVQGVLAHELGHITAGHVARFEERIAGAQSLTLLSLLAGVGAVLAGAPPEAGFGLFGIGMQAGTANFLSFNRNQEAATDLAGARYLSGAEISGRGMIKFFERLRSFEIRRGYSQADEAAYGRTHPLSGDRVATLRELLESDPAWAKPDDAELQERFLQVRAKLYGYIAEPARTLNLYPESDTSLAG
ncbi:MAG: M48 family metalloprotease, partial [Pseudomonadota bacterium]